VVSTASASQGSYGQGKSGNFEGVRENQGKSGKTERVREKSGNFKIPLTRPIIYALFSQFLPASGGGAPPL